MIYAATTCGFHLLLQQHLVVGFQSLDVTFTEMSRSCPHAYSFRNRLATPHSLELNSMLCFGVAVHKTPKGASTMEWVTPQHEEIDLNCEVSSYANAEL
jgi:hypothetical protein